MPVDSPLSDDEQAVLEVLMAYGRPPAQRSARAIAVSLAMDLKAVARALRSLESREPYLAHRQPEITLEEEVRFSSHHAAEAMEDEL